MLRLDIISQAEEFECSEEYINQLVEVLDHFESKFREINDLLEIKMVDDLDQIGEAKTIAEREAFDLY
jgi:hypothetical protein